MIRNIRKLIQIQKLQAWKPQTTVQLIDNTERKKVEEQLRKSEENNLFCNR